MTTTLCVDFGSTFTKGVLVDDATGALVTTASSRTTVETDVMDGYAAVRAALSQHEPPDHVLACSSAGGGLRLAVVGHERLVTTEAGHRVGLSAGAKVIHVSAGPLDAAGIRTLRAAAPDVLLLVGGTDGGNAESLLHNAARLARARMRAPVVVAGNAVAAPEAAELLEAAGRSVLVADNVLPRIGVVEPDSARAAIRDTFLRHVIGGKGLSRGPAFGAMVQAPTPDAMLAGVEVLADVFDGDVMVIDVGGATTDVYSAVLPQGEDAVLRREVVAPLRYSRTVEGDLGMRWNVSGIVEAASAERLPLPAGSLAYAALVGADVRHLPKGSKEWRAEVALARTAAVVAARRHGRPSRAGGAPRSLQDVRVLVGSGGVLRHAPGATATAVLDAVRQDIGGGWRPPEPARTTVDTAYVLFAVGLLSTKDAGLARRLAGGLRGEVSG